MLNPVVENSSRVSTAHSSLLLLVPGRWGTVAPRECTLSLEARLEPRNGPMNAYDG